MMLLDFWKKLNAALAVRGEPDALYGEARAWFESRAVSAVDERLVNQVVNARKAP
jgi:hypothetical protein